MLKYYRYGLDEAVNLLIAAERRLPVPKVYGYGHIYNRYGLVIRSILLEEDLKDLLSLDDYLLLSRRNEDEIIRFFMLTVPILARLYEARCNHIDVNSGAIMISKDDSNKIYILDFERSKWLHKASKEVLMAEAGRLCSMIRNYLSEKVISEWLEQLFSAINIDSDAERKRMVARFLYYFENTHLLSKKERQSVK